MHRFYCPQTSFKSPVIITDRKEIHHIKDVLRLKKGAEILLFNDQNQEARGRISSIKTNEVVLHVDSVKQASTKTVSIILACAIPKKSKFEKIIEKATELGADEIVPLLTKRTEIVLKGPRVAQKKDRYQTVAVNAAKQSQRLNIPAIHPPTKFKDFINDLSETDTVIIPSLCGRRENLLTVLTKHKQARRLVFLIGPEGDFTPEEYALAWDKGCAPVTLGATVLKVETAAIATLACANAVLAAPAINK